MIVAVFISTATLWITSATDEEAMYGREGPLNENMLPREVAGWPAPFVADDPDTSVAHAVGIEDDFRPGPFVATISFWYLALRMIDAASRELAARGRRRARRCRAPSKAPLPLDS